MIGRPGQPHCLDIYKASMHTCKQGPLLNLGKEKALEQAPYRPLPKGKKEVLSPSEITAKRGKTIPKPDPCSTNLHGASSQQVPGQRAKNIVCTCTKKHRYI